MNKFPISPLFIPANKLDWIEKTFQKGTDSIIIDLEDSISENQKDIQRYIYCQDFNTQPYPGSYGEQPFKWIEKSFIIKRK